MKFKKLFLSAIFTMLFASPSIFAAPTKCAKVSFIGDFGSGKTAIFKKIIDEEYIEDEDCQTEEYRQADIIERVEEENLHIKLWDTPGFSDFRDEVIEMTHSSNIIYFVIDVTREYNKQMFDYLDKMYREIISKNSSCKIVFLLTKYDKGTTYPANVAENIKTVKALNEAFDNEYFLTSTKNFQCKKQNFISSANIKQHMIKYFRQHINTLPSKHEDLRVPSTHLHKQRLAEKDRIHKEYVDTHHRTDGTICSVQ